MPYSMIKVHVQFYREYKYKNMETVVIIFVLGICLLNIFISLSSRQIFTYIAQISGNGYTKMTKNYIRNLKNTWMEIDITFATKQRDGLILWQGKITSDWIRIGLEDGYLEFTSSFGQGETLQVRSSSR
jgi:hypothetical protein